MTTTLMASTEAQLNQDIATADAAATGSFIIDLQSNITETTNLTQIDLQSGVTLTVNGENHTLDDAGGYSGFVVNPVDPVSVLTFENLSIINTVPPPPPSSAFSGTDTIASGVTVDQTMDLLLGGTSGAGIIVNRGTYEIDQLTAGVTGGPFGEAYGPAIYDSGVAGDLFNNTGTLVKLANSNDHSGVSEIFVNVTDTGTISVPDGQSNLRFDGANNSFSGTYVGGGMIDYGDPLTPGYGTDDLGTINMTNNACTTSWATVNQSGVVTVSDNTTIGNHGTWNFTSDNGIALSTSDPSNSGAEFYNYNTLAKTGGTGTTVIASQFYGGGGFIDVASGTLAFDGLINTFFYFEAISGAGTLSLGGGGESTIWAGTITTAGWTVTGAGTNVTLYETLSYSGAFAVQSGASLTLSAQYVNNATLTLANLMGSGGSVTIDSGATLVVNGTVNTGETIAFAGGQAVLEIGAISQFAGTIQNFASADFFRIDATMGINAATPHYNSANNITSLALTESGSSIGSLSLAGNYSADSFTVTKDPNVTGAFDVAFVAADVSITGTAQEGQTLTAVSNGSFNSYRWQALIGTTWTDIGGATSPTFVVPGSVDGEKLRVVAKATGGKAVDSAATKPVVDAPPELTIANDAITVAAGGSVALGVSVSIPSAGDTVTLKITGLRAYESITDTLDGEDFKGGAGAITLTAAEVDSGLTLNSSYGGKLEPVNTLTLTATNATGPKDVSATPQSITVTDPPTALLTQTLASFGASGSGGSDISFVPLPSQTGTVTNLASPGH